MIANKILPALYILDLEGEAANMEFLLGQDFGFQKVTIGSYDFANDLTATAAAQEAVDFLFENPNLILENFEESVEYNPEFFPSIPAIVLTEDQISREAMADDYANSLASEPGQIPVVVTRRFDPLGDYVVCRMESVGLNYKMKMRICINPEVYMEEVGKIKEEEIGRATGPHRELAPPQVSLH